MSTAEIITLPGRLLDRVIPVTIFPDAFAQRMKVREVAIRDLPERMTKQTAASKRRLPLLKLATFGDQRSPANCLRTNDNMVAIHGVEGDYDREEVGIDEAARRLREAGLAAIVYTSPSHTPDKPRWRVLCFTSAPMEPKERAGLVARLNGVLGGILGDESFIQSQSFYYGRLRRSTSYRVELIDGRAIDLADDLDAGALGKRGKPWLEIDPDELGAAPPDWQRHKPRIVAALNAIPEDEREAYVGPWFDCIAALHYESGGSAEGREIGREWSAVAANFDIKKTFDYHWASLRRKSGQVKAKGTIFRYAIELGGWDPKSVPEARPSAALLRINPATLQDLPVPERQWLVPEWIPMKRATGLYGGGGEGKTLLAQMLATACALGKPWLGLPVTQCRSLLLFCEDDLDEMWQRQAAINRLYECDFKDLGAMRWEPRLGDDNTLMSFTGTPARTPLFDQVLQEAKDFGARLVFTDTLGDVFDGNENDRRQARAFAQQTLAYMAREIEGAVVTPAHPSRAGIREGTGESGSTAWQGTFRSLLYLSTPKDEEGQPLDRDLRILSKMKANASRRDAIELRWRAGVLVPVRPPLPAGVTVEARSCEAVFLGLIDKTTGEGQAVSHKPQAGNYAPRLFAKRPDAERFTRKQFEVAMQALFAAGEIAIGARDDVRGRSIECLVRTYFDPFMADSTVYERGS